jgi:hypothetical protein
VITLAEDNNTSSVKASQKEPSTAAKKRKSITKAKGNTLICVHHGKELSTENDNFYKVNKGSIFKSLDYIPVCKACVKKIYADYYHQMGKDYIQAMYMTCRKLDVKFDLSTCEGAINRANGDGSNIVGHYFSMINSLQQNTHPSSFDDSDKIEMKESFEDLVNKIQSSGKLDAEDKRNLKDIKKKLGYDPFEGSGYTEFQLGKMYQELVSYLEDDELVGEAWKLNVILQIINNNQQIRQIDLYISLLSNNVDNFKENIATLASLNTTKQKLVEANMKIYKENGWITTDTTGRSKLSGMMKKYKDYGFDEIEVNYFDMLMSDAIRKVFDISHQSIIDTLNLDSDEMKQVFVEQRNLIRSKDEEIAKLFEEKRQLAIELRDFKNKVGG